MEIFPWSLWEISYTMSISPTRFSSNWAIFVYAVNTNCICFVYRLYSRCIHFLISYYFSHSNMPSLLQRYAISLWAIRLLSITNKVSLFNLSIKIFHIFLEIQRGLSNIICIFATSFAHDGLSASRAEWFLRVKQITTIAVIRRM